MTLRAEELINICKELTLDTKNGLAQQDMGEAILDLLRDKDSQDEIDMALTLAMAESKSLHSFLSSHLEWHICHQVKMIEDEGQFFMSQVLLPISISNNGEKINPEISGLAINHLANDFLSLLEMPEGSIVIFNENLQRGIDLRGSHVKRFNVPNVMNSNEWPYVHDNLTLPDTGAMLYLYAMVFEPIAKNQKSLNIDKYLTSPLKTRDWRKRTQSLLQTHFKSKGQECEILVGNPSSYSVALNQSSGYLKISSVITIVNNYITELLSSNAIVILNQAPSNQEISIQIFDGNVCQCAFSYGEAVFKSGMDCNPDFYDREWLKESLIDLGFENVVMDNKEINGKDLKNLLNSSRLSPI